MNAKLNESDVERVEMLHAKCAEMKKELAKRVVAIPSFGKHGC